MSRIAFLLALLHVLVGCSGGLHARGDERFVVRGSYGDPIVGSALSYDGNGSARNAGIGAGYEFFVQDRVALGGTVGYRYWDQSDGGVHSAEAELGVRHFVWELGDVAFSIDVFGGVMVGSRSVPEAGTAANLLLGFGPTVEIPLGDGAVLMVGYRFQHLSNGKGRSEPDNPTQNDNRIVVGIAIDW